MRAMIKICLQYFKHKCKYIPLEITLNVLSFKFKTFSKCALVHFQPSSTLALSLLDFLQCFCITYVSEVGSLMYAMVFTRPYITHAVGVLSRYMSKSGKGHWTTVKRVFRYFCGTASYGLCYQGRPGLDKVLDIHGFVDVDWVGDLDRRRYTSEYVFNLFRGAISWMRKGQTIVALSTTEFEYMAATHASREALWLARLCSGIGLVQQAVRIDCES
jgi:hypothetical protein